jgi:hypothetical protein
MANAFNADNALATEPESFVVGDFVQWKRTDLGADYPNTDYTASYVSRDATGGSHEFTVIGTSSGSDYLFTILGASSSGFSAGHHHWHLEIKRNSDNERIVLESGHWDIEIDVDVNGVDPRSHAEIMVQKIESVLQGKADSDVSNYSIQGRSLTKMSYDELMNARKQYKSELRSEKAKEMIKRGKGSSATIKVTF